MKRLIFPWSLLIMALGVTHAQYTFDWMQGAGNYSKTSVMSTIDPNDNLIVTGFLQNDRLFVRKYDISGNLQWEVEDVSGISGIHEKSNWIDSDANGNIFVVGNIYSYSASTGWDYPTDIVVLKYNPSGMLLWRTILPISITITSLNRFNMRSVMDDSGNLYIGSTVNSPEGAILYKLDTNGNLIFTSSSLENLPRNFSSIKIMGTQIVMVTGSPTTNVGPVFVFDTSGNLLWTAAVEGIIASDVEIDENLNVYVLSSLNNAVSPTSGYDMTITKFDSFGSLLWVHHFDFEGMELASKMVYSNGRLSAIGYGISSLSSPYFDWKTFQTDSNGNLLWHAIYDASAFNDEEPYHITSKPDGEVIVTGKGGPSPDPNNPSFLQMPIVAYNGSGTQIWMDTPNIYGGWGLATMLASNGSLYAISSSDMTVYHYFGKPLGIDSFDVDTSKLLMSPNPVSATTTLEFESNISSEGEIVIFNLQGKRLKTIGNFEVIQGKNRILLDVADLVSGLYLCSIQCEDTFLITKFIKE